eukprot:TRINITY_DN22606_c0_g1_i2.p1 TRINITY_DN22606_c0_g1~~TRINITY_DN22606_c0_g1_i2.p1  ORF type:complete len:421 (+),score=56.45 TRINITY_DN22606_c0_g1_i2:43-1263(+)
MGDKRKSASGVKMSKFGKPRLFTPESEGSELGAVVWLHGFGDVPDGWASAFQPLRASGSPYSQLRWIHLRAPSLPQPAYRGERVPAWGQFVSKKCIHVGGPDYDDSDEAGMYASSVQQVMSEIEALEKSGVPPGKVIVGGFSQGAAVALETVLTSKHSLAGCIALSGWLSLRARKALESRSTIKTPVLLCHGTKDDMVGFDCATAASAALEAAGVKAQFEKYEGLDHSSCPQELKALASFISSNIAPSVEAASVDFEEDGSGLCDSDDDAEITYVSKTALELFAQRLQNKEQVPKTAELSKLMDSDGIADDETMVPVPVDLIVDMDDLVEKLGAKGAIEIFVQGVNAALNQTEKHMPLAQWREYKSMQMHGFEEGEEEEEAIEASEESDDQGEPSAPMTKRPKLKR